MRQHVRRQHSDVNADEATPGERIWQVVANIPAGTVATYGQVAALAGLPRRARLVGQVLAALPSGSRLPWHRVVNAQGRSSLPGAAGERQRELLREEGVVLTQGRVRLARYRWTP
jgi:methylated-DNA-protein-cysteine methyltransferase-like protein